LEEFHHGPLSFEKNQFIFNSNNEIKFDWVVGQAYLLVIVIQLKLYEKK